MVLDLKKLVLNDIYFYSVDMQVLIKCVKEIFLLLYFVVDFIGFFLLESDSDVWLYDGEGDFVNVINER